jgi:hypothetical protein
MGILQKIKADLLAQLAKLRAQAQDEAPSAANHFPR